MDRAYPDVMEVEEAVEAILVQVKRIGSEKVLLEEADGRILSEDIFAGENIPPFSRSPYDGYAFRSRDVESASQENPITLRVIEEIPAGKEPVQYVHQGEAAKILTGAPVPEGADCVQMFEKTQFTSDCVTIFSPLSPGSNICQAGEDVHEGQLLLQKGTKLSAGMIGLLAGLGHREISCCRRLRISIISTGSELVSVDSPLTPGKIRNSSSYTLRSFLRGWGMEAEIFGIVPDDCEEIAKAVDHCAKISDVVVTTGGVSVGDYDFVEAAMEKLNARLLYRRLRMKPGMASMAAVYKEKLILCLSGNPSAAFAAFCMVGRPVLHYMAGCREYRWKKCQVRLLKDFPKKSPSRRFIPGRLRIEEDGLWLDFSRDQGNGMIHQWDSYDFIGEIAPGTPPLKKGSLIKGYYYK